MLQASTFADGTSFDAAYSIKTSEYPAHSSRFMQKPTELVKKIQFCRNRMVEKQLNLNCSEAFNKLKSIQTPAEKTTREQINLYKCFVDQVLHAATVSDPKTATKQINETKKWFDTNLQVT